MSQARTTAGGQTSLIAGVYEVDLSQPLPEFGAGLPNFAVRDHTRDRNPNLMAQLVEPSAPARPVASSKLVHASIDHLLTPLAQGATLGPDGRQAWFIVTGRPPGPPLWPSEPDTGTGFRPWSESEILDCVLRPAALVLEQLDSAGLTHRAIRPNNIFRAGPGTSVTIGAAWAAPPASLQPCVFEPPYSGMCHQAGRGDGTIADDVYALGVLLLCLASGRLPLQGLDDDAIVQRKLDRGSFAALAGDMHLPSTIADLVRGMLAEDPDHRTQPLLLADPLAARGRRVAARPPQRAQRPLELGAVSAWEARSLAFAIARAPEAGLKLLRGRAVDNWLRRTLGDPGLALRITDAVAEREADPAPNTSHADAVLAMRAVAILDPLAPMCWDGLALFPDGIGPLLAAGGPAEPAIETLIHTEAATLWAEAHPDRDAMAAAPVDIRHQRLLLKLANWSGGLPRLRYALNPLLACRSPILAAAHVARLQDLLPALENLVPASATMMIDQEIAAFISARFLGRMDADFTILSQREDRDIDPPGQRGLAQLRVLSRLCEDNPTIPHPNLATILLREASPALAHWKSQTTRARCERHLRAAAQRGMLPLMRAILEDADGLADDAQAADHAMRELRHIEQQLALLADQRAARAASAAATGQEIAAALGVMALAVAAVLSAL